jgi:hypothetical protein
MQSSSQEGNDHDQIDAQYCQQRNQHGQSFSQGLVRRLSSHGWAPEQRAGE